MKVGFFAHHPGPCNTLTPIIKRLREKKEYELFLFPFHTYVQKEWETKECFEESTFSLKEYVPKDLDVLFYCASSLFPSERAIPSFCKKHNIISISTVDIFWANDETLLERFKEVPDYIITPNKATKEQIERLNIQSTVLDLGCPQFDSYFTSKKKIINIKKPYTVSFISVPSGNELASPTSKRLQKFFHELIEVTTKYPDLIQTIYYCHHPRETHDFYDSFLEKNPELSSIIQKNPYQDTPKACEVSDIIIGDTSTVLYTQAMLRKKVIFYKTKELLEEYLKEPERIPDIADTFNLPENATDNILKFLETLKK